MVGSTTSPPGARASPLTLHPSRAAEEDRTADRWTGAAHVYGDDVDTDVLYPGRYLMVTDNAEMAKHAAEDLDPAFRSRVRAGDVFVAGRNIGCGSSREQAVVALKTAGIRAIVCASAARIFFRNAMNLGLPVLRIGPAAYDEIRARVATGDALDVDLAGGRIVHPASGSAWQAEPIPAFLRTLLADGGLLPHLKKRLAERRVATATVGGDARGPA